MEEIKYTLLRPVVTTFTAAGGTPREETLTEVTLTEPQARDLVAMDAAAGDIARSIVMVAACSGLMRVQVEKMGTRDFMALSALAAGFFNVGQETGETFLED